MLLNTQLRQSVAAHLTDAFGSSVKQVLDSWTMIDADEDTPAVMVYLDDGDLDTEYMDQNERYDGVLTVSIYLGRSTTDADLDALGEQVKNAMPIGFRIVNVARFYRTSFSYERSENGAYRALHLNHHYKSE
ncbi:phage tail terminator protein [Vibrio vulnificus]|uniref:phage tail terminator protein n=1 Tax=Vibrio vulnificus TaxID=672 RepID=UPI004059B6DC